jgi:hypothetical protein
MAKIIFFNHYHRGDLLTSREFVRQITKELQDVEFAYMHFNHPKLTRDLDIPKIGDPSSLDPKTPFYQDGDDLYVNTWIGCFWDIFCQHGGINMFSLWHQWEKVYETINAVFGSNLKLNSEKEYYLPSIDYSRYNLKNVNAYLEQSKDRKKILLCNGVPKSGQSFADNMSSFIHETAKKYSNIDFICTEKFEKVLDNILFTDDIIGDNEIEDNRAPWEDRQTNLCDLYEISYLSTKCEAIVGKNSGPFVFCETKENYMDPEKKFLSYNVSWGPAFHTEKKSPTETMSHGLKYNCDYMILAIEGPYLEIGNLNNLTDDDKINIQVSLNELAQSL